MILVPICYGLLMTLTIRGCMEEGGPEGILLLLKADWTHITSPRAWIEAAKFVFISMQLGLLPNLFLFFGLFGGFTTLFM